MTSEETDPFWRPDLLDPYELREAELMRWMAAHTRTVAAQQNIYDNQLNPYGGQLGLHGIASTTLSSNPLGGAYSQHAGLNAFTGGSPIIGTGYCSPAPVPAYEDAGIRAGEIIAHRCWCVDEDGELFSTGVGKLWSRDGRMSGTPTKYAYGVHCYKEESSVYVNHSMTNMAVGRIRIWGEIYEDTLGYRAEHAKIIAIDNVNYNLDRRSAWFWRKARGKDMLQRVRENYGLPLDGTPRE